MPIDRFYTQEPFTPHSTISITGPEHHHLAHVVRIHEGEWIELVNGRGAFAKGKVVKIDKKAALVEIFSSDQFPSSTHQIELAVPLMHSSKLGWIVEKGTEIGIHAFLFYTADYSEREKLSESQIERLRIIAIAALKQSGRLYLPTFAILPHLESIFHTKAQILFGAMNASKGLGIDLQGADTIIFVTGPERGFSENELTLLKEKGEGVCLNPNTLRAETAPIVAASILGQLLTKSRGTL